MANEFVFSAIDGQKWIDGVSDVVQPAVHDALQAAGGLKDVLHGTWLGHPLHPVLTDVPVGAWTAAMAIDAVELITGRDDAGDAADLAVGVGLAGALAAAVAGAADWSETNGSARRIGIVHASLNIVATGLYATSLALRRGSSRRAGIGLSMIGYAIASASAYLGGHLVFGEQVGVDHTATENKGQPSDWTRVLRYDELQESTPTRVEAAGVRILLVRMNGAVHALNERCPHMGGPLSEGKLEGDSIVCPWHGSTFCLSDGNVERGPSAFPAPRFEVRIRDGQIEVKAAESQ